MLIENEDDIELIQEIPDSEVVWTEELVDVYTAKGEEFFLDDLIESFPIFCRYMFFMKGFREPTTIQRMIIEFIATPTEKDKLVQAPRSSGKSFISQLKTLWDLLRNNDETVLVRSASDKRSRNYTTFLLNTIKTTPLLQHLSPRGNQRKSTELFDVNGAGVSDSPTVSSYSIGATVTGLRSTKTVLDDIEVLKNSSTEDTRETLIAQRDECYNLLSETYDEDGNQVSGEVLVLGTFQTSMSIYVDMVRSGAYECLIIPAEYPPVTEWYREFVTPEIMEVSINNPDMIGKAIDERINDKVLAKKKLLSRSNYELHYMLNPNLNDELKYPLKLRDLMVVDIDEQDNPIRVIYGSEHKIRDLKHKGFTSDNFVKPAYMSKERLPFEFTILAVDPSGRGSDETGWIVISLLAGKIWVRDFGGVLGGYEDESLQQLLEVAKRYNVNETVVESNFGDGAYTKMLETHFKNEHKCAIMEVRASMQKERRIIETLEPLMNQHRILVDRASLEKDYLKKSVYSLTYQLTHITKEPKCLKHDDIVDVWELACKYVVEYMANDGKRAEEKYKQEKQKIQDDIFRDGLFPHLKKKPKGNSYLSKF